VFVGLTFTVDTSLLANFPYSSISMSGGLGVTAELVGGGMLTANAVPRVHTATLDFSGITISAAGQTYKMRVEIDCGDPFKSIDLTITIGNNTTPADVIAAIEASLSANDYYEKAVGNKLTIGDPKKAILQTVTITSYTKTDNNGIPIPDNTLKGPKLTALAGDPIVVPEVKYNGTTLTP
jgi:hypothetical protein